MFQSPVRAALTEAGASTPPRMSRLAGVEALTPVTQQAPSTPQQPARPASMDRWHAPPGSHSSTWGWLVGWR